MSDSKSEQVFLAQLDELEAGAREVGMTKRALAIESGVSPATLPRWRRNPPATVRALGKMQKTLDAKRGS